MIRKQLVKRSLDMIDDVSVAISRCEVLSMSKLKALSKPQVMTYLHCFTLVAFQQGGRGGLQDILGGIWTQPQDWCD